MQVKVVLGSMELVDRKHAIAKLTNGRYALGQLSPGMRVAENEQFDCLDAAFDHWCETFPAVASHQKAA